MTKEQFEQMLTKAKPLMEWLADNFHPHCELTVTQSTVELKESAARNSTEEFVKP